MSKAGLLLCVAVSAVIIGGWWYLAWTLTSETPALPRYDTGFTFAPLKLFILIPFVPIAFLLALATRDALKTLTAMLIIAICGYFLILPGWGSYDGFPVIRQAVVPMLIGAVLVLVAISAAWATAFRHQAAPYLMAAALLGAGLGIAAPVGIERQPPASSDADVAGIARSPDPSCPTPVAETVTAAADHLVNVAQPGTPITVDMVYFASDIDECILTYPVSNTTGLLDAARAYLKRSGYEVTTTAMWSIEGSSPTSPTIYISVQPAGDTGPGEVMVAAPSDSATGP